MRRRDRHSILVFVSLTYVSTWAIWAVGIFGLPNLTGIGDERFRWFLLAGSFCPTACALVTAGLSGGRAAIRDLLARLLRLRVDWKVYVATFFLLPMIGLSTMLAMGIAWRIELWKIAVTAVALMPVNALMGGVIFGVGPLGEEMGWRGLLQERLQGRFGSVATAVVVGLVWAVWHFPTAIAFPDFRNGISLPQFIGLYPLSTILIAFSMGHLWRWSRGSLFIAVFFHAVVNTTAEYLMSATWWDFADLSSLRRYLIVLAVFGLMAGATELLSRTVMRRAVASGQRVRTDRSGRVA